MREELQLSLEDHQKAKREVAFLLNILAQTITDVIGDAAGAVGTAAGREAARKMPLYFEQTDLEATLAELKKHFEGGFDWSYALGKEEFTMTFKHCALKEICQIEHVAPGEDLCRHFHDYLNGVIIEHSKERYKVDSIQPGDCCLVKHRSF
ncbi:MAG: hypothetical protein ACM3SY_06045 [Candidatus Omnitrophota bacterium]